MASNMPILSFSQPSRGLKTMSPIVHVVMSAEKKAVCSAGWLRSGIVGSAYTVCPCR